MSIEVAGSGNHVLLKESTKSDSSVSNSRCKCGSALLCFVINSKKAKEEEGGEELMGGCGVTKDRQRMDWCESRRRLEMFSAGVANGRFGSAEKDSANTENRSD